MSDSNRRRVEFIVHPELRRFIQNETDDETSLATHAMRAGVVAAVATGSIAIDAAPAAATNTTDANNPSTISDQPTESSTTDQPDETASFNFASNTVQISSTVTSGEDSPGEGIISGLGETIRPGDAVKPGYAVSTVRGDEPATTIEHYISYRGEDAQENAQTVLLNLHLQGEPSEPGIEHNHNTHEADPDVAKVNMMLGSIEVASEGSINVNQLRDAIVAMDAVRRADDPHRLAGIPEIAVKLYTHNEAPGLMVPFTVAQKTANVERYGTIEAVTFIYAAAEIYQQMVEREFPQYAGSMLRVRDLFSPFHATHHQGDVDLSTAMNGEITQYSDGPIMDKHSPNYDAEFTQRFLEEIARLELDGVRLAKQAVFEDWPIINHLDSTIDPAYGGWARWHEEHVHMNISGTSLNWRMPSSMMPWGLDKDLLINGEAVQLTEQQINDEHGPFMAFIESGDMPTGSVRSQLQQPSPEPEPVYASAPVEAADLTVKPANTDTGVITIEGDTYFSPQTAFEVTPVLTDITEVDQTGYEALVSSAMLPDPMEYKYFGNGNPVTLQEAMELSELYTSGQRDAAWAEDILMRHTPEELFDMYRLAGFPLYDIPNLIGLSKGESAYFAHIVGDRDPVNGGAIGINQQLPKYMTDPSLTHLDMFDAWLNILETRAKYIESWQIHGFEGRFKPWNAVNDNTPGFQAGTEEGKAILERYIAENRA